MRGSTLKSYPKRMLERIGSLLLRPLSASPSVAERVLLGLFGQLPLRQRNRVATKMIDSMLREGDSYLYGLSIYKLYCSYLEYFLPGRRQLHLLEIGPGKSFVTPILWAGHPAVETVTVIDKYDSELIRDPYYYTDLIRCVEVALRLPRPGYLNFFPFGGFDVKKCKKAFVLDKDGLHFNEDVVRHTIYQDFDVWSLGDDYFDFVYSHATLEHVDNPLKTITEIARVLRPGGITVHQIDLRDHRFPDEPLRFLAYTDEEWIREQQTCSYTLNRWRADGFRKAFVASGLELLWEGSAKLPATESVMRSLDARFREVPRSDLLKTGVTFLLRKRDELPV
jgi:SAM-dependent methyltransferase